MVSIHRSYRCSKCRKGFRSFREAEDCELDHIVKDATDGFKADLEHILNPAALPTRDAVPPPPGSECVWPAGHDVRAVDEADLLAACKPFINCLDQIADDESDEEWAKFRLLVGDYRRLRNAATALRSQGGEGK